MSSKWLCPTFFEEADFRRSINFIDSGLSPETRFIDSGLSKETRFGSKSRNYADRLGSVTRTNKIAVVKLQQK